MESKLDEDGLIPAFTDCPFRFQCDYEQWGMCCHRGEKRKTEYSCTKARLFNCDFQKEKKQ